MADEAVAREQLAKSNEAKAKSVEDAYGHMGKPTPTQEENDLAALGVVVDPKEDDGSGPPMDVRMTATRRQSEPQKPSGAGGYQTRGAAPAKETPAAPARETAAAKS